MLEKDEPCVRLRIEGRLPLLEDERHALHAPPQPPAVVRDHVEVLAVCPGRKP